VTILQYFFVFLFIFFHFGDSILFEVTNLSEISNNIKRYRKVAKMTQDDLAKATKLSISFVSKLETGNKEPSLETIFKISNALGIQPYHIIGRNSRLLNEFLQSLDPNIRDELSNDVFYSEFEKISNLLEDHGYEVNMESSNGISTVTISDETGTVSEMLEVDFVNLGNDLLESIDKFARFSVEEFVKNHNNPRK
jgi:transcriptional regulator with XRE-family HTH domain